MIRLAVIGDPIEHSLSPVVHSAALEQLGIPFTYEKIKVKKNGLEAFFRYAAEKKIDGFNLTMPHKVDILPYLYEIDGEAERFQSVNTVKVRDGKLYGYNTDAEGYKTALNMTGRRLKDSRVVILGAGGVVRTLALKAAFEEAASIQILNRTVLKAETIASMVWQRTGMEVAVGELNDETLKTVCKNCDILIQATPLGMQGIDQNFKQFAFLDALPKDALVSDLIYQPDRTLLLRMAEERGLATLNGLGMLIFQALLADRIYTGAEFHMPGLYYNVLEAVHREIQT
ncbi:shikimate dehydrogenase [Ructibacterium gallinarum]|uniref:Shikimate dehydrogenase (NADP(+)) n=1 Tax=Ructibacterium gallinarum TaxID=2779355 RepID=A0A9D5R804_9FIRM|nr:shikimate dehydrogenase [Ructibacterium gallinarum]MBE5039445.1 shikimate dehydrogenase [Ructibacterium gallinarum]